jgi:hypothetical protein
MKKMLLSLNLLPPAEVDKFLQDNRKIIEIMDRIPIEGVRISFVSALLEKFYAHVNNKSEDLIPLQQMN